MFTIISIILIVICLVVIMTIIVKKLPSLAILNVDSLPGEKEASFKDKIIKARVERDLAKWGGIFGRIFIFLDSKLSSILKMSQNHLKKMKISHKAKIKMPFVEKQKQIKELILSADDLIKQELLNEAEEKLVEVISLDQKNLEAFFKLGGIYEELKKYPEARQTYEYALKLAKQYNDEEEVPGGLSVQEVYFSLAWLEKEAGNIEAAINNISEALELEQNSPRYLDLILDLSIMRKDKDSALKYFEKLSVVNPENNKLLEIKEEIDSL